MTDAAAFRRKLAALAGDCLDALCDDYSAGKPDARDVLRYGVHTVKAVRDLYGVSLLMVYDPATGVRFS